MSEALAGHAPGLGRRWEPPRVSGPLVTFRGRNPAATEIEDEAKAAIQAAIEAGFQRGYSEGIEAAAAEVTARLQRLEDTIVSLSDVFAKMARPLERLDDAATEEMARLALGVGAQLARRDLQQDPAQVIEIIRACIRELPASARELRVHLHPADAAAVRERLDALRNETAWSLVDDPSVGRSGVRVILDSSQIDARLDTRVAVACEAVLAESRGPIRGDVLAELEAEGGLR
jgi:flagellar assembly protein FliH